MRVKKIIVKKFKNQGIDDLSGYHWLEGERRRLYKDGIYVGVYTVKGSNFESTQYTPVGDTSLVYQLIEFSSESVAISHVLNTPDGFHS